MSAYMKQAEIAKEVFGWSPSRFSERKADLIKGGFPAPDPLVGKWLREDVNAWCRKRRRIHDTGDTAGQDGGAAKINFDAL